MNINERLKKLMKDPDFVRELKEQDAEVKKESAHYKSLTPEQQRIISRSITRSGA